MARLLFIAATAILLLGCAEDVSKFYTQAPGATQERIQANATTCDEPTILPERIDEHLLDRMYKRGYAFIGQIAFNGANVQNNAMDYAKKVHACVVVEGAQYTNTVSGVMGVPQYNPGQNVQINSSGNIYGPHGTVTYQGTTTGQTSGSYSTSYIPYSQNRYDYVYAFFVRLKENPVFGAWVIPLEDNLKRSLNIEHGGLVRAVRDNSPADKAGFIAGDIILSINDVTPDSNSNAAWEPVLKENQGKETTFTLIRNGNTLTKKVILGTSH